MVSPPPVNDQDARTQRHLEFLDTLIAKGMDLANRVHQQATTPAEPDPALAEPDSALAESDSALAESEAPQTGAPATPPITPPLVTAETVALFDQISRAVRRTILVARKLAEPLPLAPAKPNPGRSAPDLAATRKRIIRDVEDTIHAKAKRAEADTLQAELHERVESVDLDDDIGNRPVHEIIAEICRDLGITSTWEQERFKRRTPEDLQALNARAARQTSPAQPTATSPRPSRPHLDFPDPAEPVVMAPHSYTEPEPRPPKR